MLLLRKAGTHLIFPRTGILAKRADMVPCTEEEAKEHRELQDKANKKAAAEAQEVQEQIEEATAEEPKDPIEDEQPPPEDPEPEEITPLEKATAALAELDRDALLARAEDLKVHIHPQSKDDTIRKKLAGVIAADGEQE